MAGVRDSELVGFLGWPRGIDNISKENDLARGAARAAENVDFDARGKATRRPGRTLVAALPGLHSLWTDGQYPFMLGVYEGAVMAFDDTLTPVALFEGLADTVAPMSYDYAAGSVFYSNGTDSGQITPAAIARPWAPEAPAGQPVAAAITGSGGLYAGNYQVAITYIDDNGRESGSPLAVEVTVPEGGGIALSGIPQPSGSDTAWVRIYVSPANGDVLYFCQDLIVGLTSANIGVHESGKAMDTQFLESLPAGQFVAILNGRLFVARGRMLYWSEALHYGLGRLRTNYVRFDDTITLLAAAGEGAEAGLYIAVGNEPGKRTYYMAGPDPKAWQRKIARTHGAVPGSLSKVDQQLLGLEGAGDVPTWLASDGQFVIGLPGGMIAPLHQKTYAAPTGAERGSVAMRAYNGMHHLIAALKGGTPPSTSGMAATDTATAEVFRNGIQVG